MRINRSLITNFQQNLDWGFVTGTPTTLSGYGITDAVPTSRTLTINGTTYDLTANRTWTIATVSGSGTTNYIPKFTSSTALGDSLIYDSGTNVGIGTTTPFEKLDVRGKTYINNGGELYIDPNATNTILATTGARPLLFEVNSINAVAITSGGNVGIGTTSPSGAAGLALALNGGGSQTRIALKNSTTGDASGDGFQILLDSGGVDVALEQRENGSIRFATNNTLCTTITSSGNFIISNSTTDSGERLQVTGTAKISSTISASSYYSNGVELITSDGSANYLKTGATLYIQSGSSTVGTITNAGAATFNSTIKTGAPTGGTAQPWKLGTVITDSCGVPPDYDTFENMLTAQFIEIEINGTTYYVPVMNPGWC